MNIVEYCKKKHNQDVVFSDEDKELLLMIIDLEELNGILVEDARKLVTKLHYIVGFQETSWRVDAPGHGSLWTVKEKQARKRFAEMSSKVASSGKSVKVSLYRIHRGEDVLVEQFSV